MNENFNVKDALKAKSDELKTALGLQLGHPVSQGDLGEGEWLRFLNSFLPKRYAATKGFVFDSEGRMSQQIDLMIYDPLHSPLIMETKNGERYVTAESVYAVFEVKPKANKEYIEYADEKIQSVLDLKRTSRAMVASGKQVPARGLTQIIGGLLVDQFQNKADTIKKYHRVDDHIEASNEEEAVFSFFYVLLDELFKLGTVAAIDIRDYADLSLESFKIAR